MSAFKHFRYPGMQCATFALNLPTKEWLRCIVSLGLSNVTLCLGVARVHPKDQFCKRTGRQVAIGNMADVPFQLMAVEVEGERQIYDFLAEKKRGPGMEVVLSVTNQSPEVHFKHAAIG